MPALQTHGRGTLVKFLDLRPDLFVIGDEEDFSVSFDHEGRWFNALAGTWRYRRGMSGIVTRVERATRGQDPAVPTRISDADALKITHILHERAMVARDEWQRGFRKPLRSTSQRQIEAGFEKIRGWDEKRYAQNIALFRKVYGHIPILPPDQYLALYLQPVIGCRYHRCGFCTLYWDKAHHVRSDAEWHEHLSDARELFGASISTRHGLFLGDANALDMEPDALADRLLAARHIFPEMWNRTGPGIVAFQDAFGPNIPSQPEGYAELIKRGLCRIYIGLESGSDNIRKLVSKPGPASDVVAGVRTAKKAGLSISLMIIIGLGGREHHEEHVIHTARIIDECSLGVDDKIFFSRLVLDPGAPYGRLDLTPLSDTEMTDQETSLRKILPGHIQIIPYRIEGFVY